MNKGSGSKEHEHIVIRTLNVFTQPMKDRYDRHYHPRHPHGNIHLVLDTVMVMVIVLLTAGVVGFVRRSSPLAPFSATLHTSMSVPTELAATAAIRLTTREGEPLWAGPLPLAVGRETRLRVFFDVVGMKSTHRNLVLSASVVAPATIVLEHATANRGSLLITDRTVRWEIGAALEDGAAVQASVEVSVTPTDADAGKPLALFSQITGEGKDVATDAAIFIRLPDVTTASLPNNLGIIH